MLNQIDAERLSHKRYEVKVECHGGATIESMYTLLGKVMAYKPENVLLHIGTNDCIRNTSDEVIKGLKRLKDFIQKMLPFSKIHISLPTIRTDNSKASAIIRNLNTKLKRTNFLLLDNSNINEQHLGKRGLHLNGHGTKKMASNIISFVKRL